MFPNLRSSTPLALTLMFAATSCDSPSASRRGVPARVEVVSGDAQTGVVGTGLAQALVVRVLDERGEPVSGQVVSFAVRAGGGSVLAGTATTGADGVAQERWTLGGSVADTQRVEARAVDAATQVFATFRALGLPGAPALLAPASPAALPGSYTGAAGMPLVDSAAVLVKDSYGNAVPGVKVLWAAAQGTVSPDSSRSDALGVARTEWTLGRELGAQRLTAAAAGASSLELSAEAQLGPVARVELSRDTIRFDALPAMVGVEATEIYTRAYDVAGHALHGVVVDLVSLDPEVAQCSCVKGSTSTSVWPVGNGTARIVATARGTAITDTLTVVVRQRPHSAGLEPFGYLPVGDSIRPVVVVLDRRGAPIRDASSSLSSENPAIVAVSESGYLIGKSAGVASVIVTVDSMRFSRSVGVVLPFRVESVWSSDHRACVVVPGGKLYCQGFKLEGPFKFSGTNTLFRNSPDNAQQVTHDGGGSYGPCALSVTGQAFCGVTTALRFTMLAGASLPLADPHVCAIADTGLAYCWGTGTRGELGTGGLTYAAAPAAVAGSDTLRLTRIYAAGAGTCALSAGGAAYCWGAAAGEPAVSVPARVQPGRTFTTLAMGSTFVCGLDAGGAAYCWGTQTTGELGNGSLTGSSAQAQPVSGGHTFTRISAYTRHVCALTPAGEVFCWGTNAGGQLGIGVAGGAYATPQRVRREMRFKSISVGSTVSCAQGQNDVPYCWGSTPTTQNGYFSYPIPTPLWAP